jgi:hypothetical protein
MTGKVWGEIMHEEWIRCYNTGAEMKETIEILFVNTRKENSDEECEASGSITDTAFEDVNRLD